MTNVLTPDECRVLGVLIEKAQTTPSQYPLSLNAVVTGANQKNNRDPVISMDEDRALTALDGLRAKGLVREVALSGSRVEKFRHVAREVLQVSTSELVILAELLLRGPQTIGELRGNASRMHPLESIEITRNVLQSLMTKGDPTGPLIREIPPEPGSRVSKFDQLLCPSLRPEGTETTAESDTGRRSSDLVPPGTSERLASLEAEVARLRRLVEQIARSAGLSIEDHR